MIKQTFSAHQKFFPCPRPGVENIFVPGFTIQNVTYQKTRKYRKTQTHIPSIYCIYWADRFVSSAFLSKDADILQIWLLFKTILWIRLKWSTRFWDLTNHLFRKYLSEIYESGERNAGGARQSVGLSRQGIKPAGRRHIIHIFGWMTFFDFGNTDAFVDVLIIFLRVH